MVDSDAAVLVLRETRAAYTGTCPRAAAIRILKHRFPVTGETDEPGESDAVAELSSFQADAVRRACTVLDRRGGVLIADSVGMGKTHVALALLARRTARGARAAIVGPAALREHWRRTGAALPFDWISYARLSRGPLAGGYDLVVFDEAHALRNPRTRRHRNARTLCRNADVVLLSATPVNNSVWDLHHLLRLFCSDASFLDVGVPSLRSAFEQADGSVLLGAAPSLQPILRAVMIRRTRSVVSDGFPRRATPLAVRYRLAGGGTPLLSRLGERLFRLTFPAHGAAARWHGEVQRAESDPPAAGAAVELLRLGLLKRLESSVHALATSLGSYERLLERCLGALNDGLLFRVSDRQHPGGDGQLGFDLLLLSRLPPDFRTAAYRHALAAELEQVRSICSLLDVARRDDGKLRSLLRLLRRLQDHRVVVFTQYRDTARYLHHQVRRIHRTGLIDGASALLGDAVVDRREVIRRFAPLANGAPLPDPREAVDVLIATDVLAEGINLQDADVVVSYDLPWNPVRLVQRSGRIDRLGSPHDVVHSYHFVPGDLERYLRLLRRLAAKSSAIDASVGSEMPALHARLLADVGGKGGRARATEGGRPIDPDDPGDPLDQEERLRACVDAMRASGRSGACPLCTAVVSTAEDTDRSRTGSREVLVASVGRTERVPPDVEGLVAALVDGRLEWVLVRHGRTPSRPAAQDERPCLALVEAALRAPCNALAPPRPELDGVLHAARREFARREAATATSALLPSGGIEARVGRTLLMRAAALPGGPDAVTCQRIEACLDRLAAAVGADDDARLDSLLLKDSPSLDRMLALIESLPVADVPRRAPVPERTVHVVAVLLVSGD